MNAQLLLCLCLLSSACASATLVKRSPEGGRVQLNGSFMPAVSQAKVLMSESCDGYFESIEEGDQLDFHCLQHDSSAAVAGLTPAAP